MYFVLLYRIPKPYEQYDVPLLFDTFYAAQFVPYIQKVEEEYAEPSPPQIKHATLGWVNLSQEDESYEWYLFSTHNYTQYVEFIRQKCKEENMYVHSKVGVYTILVQEKPTKQEKRIESDINDYMDVDTSYKRSRFAKKYLMLLLQ